MDFSKLLGPPASASEGKGEKGEAWRGMEMGDEIICLVGEEMPIDEGEDMPICRLVEPPIPMIECLRCANPWAAAWM